MERQGGGLPPARRGPATLAHTLWHTSGSSPSLGFQASSSGAGRGERPGRTLRTAAPPLRPAARLAARAPRSSVRLYRCAVRAMRGLGFVRTAAPAATVTPAATHPCPSPAAPTASATVAAIAAAATTANAAAAAVTDAALAAAAAADAAAAPTAPTAVVASAAAGKALGRVDEGEAARRSRRVALELSRPARHNAQTALRNSAAHHLPHTAG